MSCHLLTCRVSAVCAENEETSAAPQRWEAPTMWTLPMMSYPAARKAAHLSAVAMSVDMEGLVEAGSTPDPKAATPNMAAKIMRFFAF